MFSRALEVRLAKPTKSADAVNQEIIIDAEKIGEQVERAIFAIGTVLVSKRILDTACEVVLIAARSKFN